MCHCMLDFQPCDFHLILSLSFKGNGEMVTFSGQLFSVQPPVIKVINCSKNQAYLLKTLD